MANGVVNQHISKQFDDELENVRGKVLAMGGWLSNNLIMPLNHSLMVI